ncbi:MAG: hypothetical protein GY772_29585 [bacterium]|nr:hypothetical protein [bacterium]
MLEHYDEDDDRTLALVARVAAGVAHPATGRTESEDDYFQIPVEVDYDDPLNRCGPHRANIELALQGVCAFLHIDTPEGDLSLDTLVHVWPGQGFYSEDPLAAVKLTDLQAYTALVLVCGVAGLDADDYTPPLQDGWGRFGDVQAAIRDANEAQKKSQQGE